MKETKTPEAVAGRITRLREGNTIGPALRCADAGGDLPSKGKSLLFVLGNGKKYTGKVASAERVDGELLVRFQDGYKPA